MAKKGEKGHYARARDARSAALKKGLKEEEFEVVDGPKGFTYREKRKHVPVPDAKLHVGPDADKTIKEVLNEPVVGHDNIFKDHSNGRFRYADETQDLSQESFETIEAAEAALKRYIDEFLNGTPAPELRQSEQKANAAEAELEKKFPLEEESSNTQVVREMFSKLGTKVDSPETPTGTDPELDKMRVTAALERAVGDGEVIGTAHCSQCNSNVPVVVLYTPETSHLSDIRFTDHGDPKNDEDCEGSFTICTTEVKPLAPPATGVKPGELPPHEQAQVSNTAVPIGTDAATHAGRLKKSLISSPSKTVWQIADDMIASDPKVKRTVVIKACVDKGIAYYTARTQFQLWSAARRESLRHAEEANAARGIK